MATMANYVLPTVVQVGIPVAGSDDVFPVRRIYCVGRNYAAHAREMGSDPTREPPFFFCKPADAVLPVAPGNLGEMPYPPGTSNLHYEVELVAAIGKAGRNIPVDEALSYVWGYTTGLDMTRRDLQFALRDKGRPWELGKAFDHSAPIAPLVPVAGEHPLNNGIWLEVNGVRRQAASIADMSWSVAEVIANLSTWFELMPGDLIFTGTPEGVGPVVAGDVIEAAVEGLASLRVKLV